MSRHSAAHYFLEGLVDLGIEYIFANLGTDHVSLIEENARWDREGRKHPQVILCPHEIVAVHMAGGYALATGKGQAVFVHVASIARAPLIRRSDWRLNGNDRQKGASMPSLSRSQPQGWEQRIGLAAPRDRATNWLSCLVLIERPDRAAGEEVDHRPNVEPARGR